jgi:hypothetical protein
MFLKNIRGHLASEAFNQQCKGALYVTFLIYCLYQAIIFLSWTAMSPDEISFIAGSKVYLFFDRSPPPLNYGTFFWAILDLLKTPLVLRILFLALFIATPCLLLLGMRNYPTRLLSLLFYLSLPFAFWTGKLISPETLILFIISLSLWLHGRDKDYFAAFLAGLAIGIKVTAVPYALFLCFLIVKKPFIKKFGICILMICAGLWLANPINLDLYLISLFKNSTGSESIWPFNVDRLREILFAQKWSWDMILTNSFSQLICNPNSIAILALVFFFKNKSLGFGFIAFCLTSFALVYFSKDTFAWYFFPIVPVLIYSIGFSTPDFVNNYKLGIANTSKIARSNLTLEIAPPVIVTLLLIFNFYSNIQFSIFQAAEKFSQIQARRNYPSECVKNAIKTYRPQLIINKSDRDIDFQIIPPDTLYKGAFGSSLDSGVRSMVVVSARLLKNPYHLDTLIYQGQSVKKFTICGDIIILVSQ